MMTPGKSIQTISATVRETDQLKNFWAQYFEEIPACTHPGCSEVAHEVDHMFPYLDDNNRCRSHAPGND